MNWTIYNRLLFFCCIILGSCQTDDRKEKTASIIEVNNYVYDRTVNTLMDTVIQNLNCVIQETGYHFSKLEEWIKNDSSQILIIPFKGKMTDASTATTLLEDRLTFVNIDRIKEFVASHSFSNPEDVKGYLQIVLLHELGHIVLKLPSGTSQAKSYSQLGEQSMAELEPQILTIQKKNELKIDSLAIVWVKKATTNTSPGCFDAALNIQLVLNSAEFISFGLRIIEDFAKPRKVLIDPTNAHPNFELRLAFMNYYILPTDSKREMIDEYLYNRVEGALKRQETDPRIYQGQEKKF